MRYEYKMARKKLGLTGNTIPKELTKAQREFLYSNDRTITVKVGLHLITLSDVNSKEFYFRKRLAALEHILSILDESAMDKNSLPDFGWHFQQAK